MTTKFRNDYDAHAEELANRAALALANEILGIGAAARTLVDDIDGDETKVVEIDGRSIKDPTTANWEALRAFNAVIASFRAILDDNGLDPQSRNDQFLLIQQFGERFTDHDDRETRVAQAFNNGMRRTQTLGAGTPANNGTGGIVVDDNLVELDTGNNRTGNTVPRSRIVAGSIYRIIKRKGVEYAVNTSLPAQPANPSDTVINVDPTEFPIVKRKLLGRGFEKTDRTVSKAKVDANEDDYEKVWVTDPNDESRRIVAYVEL